MPEQRDRERLGHRNKDERDTAHCPRAAAPSAVFRPRHLASGWCPGHRVQWAPSSLSNYARRALECGHQPAARASPGGRWEMPSPGLHPVSQDPGGRRCWQRSWPRSCRGSGPCWGIGFGGLASLATSALSPRREPRAERASGAFFSSPSQLELGGYIFKRKQPYF